MADCLELMQMVITADSVLPCRHHQGQQRVPFGKIERKAAIAKAHTSEASVSTFRQCQDCQGKEAGNAVHQIS